jgi:hypothetical protein
VVFPVIKKVIRPERSEPRGVLGGLAPQEVMMIGIKLKTTVLSSSTTTGPFYTLFSLFCSLYFVLFILFSLFCSLYFVLFILFSLFCSLYFVLARSPA